MAPLQFVAFLTLVVGHSFVASARVLVAEVERTVVFVAFAVVGCRRNAPRALRVDFAEQFQVDFVADGEVIAAVAQVETTSVFVAVGRHDKTARITFRKGKEAVGNGEWQRHIAHDEMGWAKHDILTRTQFCSRDGDVKIGMGCVAGRVAAFHQVGIA